MTRLSPTQGGWYYHPFEIALSGFSGSGKTTLAEKLIPRLRQSGRSVGFLKHDAHRFSLDKPGKDTYRAREAGAAAVFIQDSRHAGIILDHGPTGPNQAAVELAWNALDLLLVEGNKRSPLPKLLLLDPRHEMDEALAVEPFPAVRAILYPAGEHARARSLSRYTPDADLICRDDTKVIVELLEREWRSRVPPLKGAVLAGGNGTTTSEGKSRVRRMADLLSGFCEDLVVSVPAGQRLPDDCVGLSKAEDRFVGFGSAGGILTVMSNDPSSAWLVVGCDPHVLEETDVRRLVSERNPLRLSTAVGGEEKLLPEPLAAIYEPKARVRLLNEL